MRSNSEPCIFFKTFTSPFKIASSGSASTSTSEPSSVVSSTTTYVTVGLSAIAVLETSVHGVVVHTRKLAPNVASGPDVIGNRT